MRLSKNIVRRDVGVNTNEISGAGKFGERHNSILIGSTTENPLTVKRESLFSKIPIVLSK